MRIIGGAWRGRRLQAPPGATTRPTADRVRQALFDRLLHAPWAGRGAVEGATVLDAFAGTGALGLEALSRGAAASVFLEHDAAAFRALEANVAACGAEARCRVLRADALRPPPGTPCSLVFLDPPYEHGLLPARAHGARRRRMARARRARRRRVRARGDAAASAGAGRMVARRGAHGRVASLTEA